MGLDIARLPIVTQLRKEAQQLQAKGEVLLHDNLRLARICTEQALCLEQIKTQGRDQSVTISKLEGSVRERISDLEMVAVGLGGLVGALGAKALGANATGSVAAGVVSAAATYAVVKNIDEIKTKVIESAMKCSCAVSGFFSSHFKRR